MYYILKAIEWGMSSGVSTVSGCGVGGISSLCIETLSSHIAVEKYI